MSDYIQHLIEKGENQTVEFKFEVSDYRKIARTLAAFSNTAGGRLLVGVKDNGAIAGVRSEEEFFMIEGAAKLYCRPEVHFTTRQWQIERKKILEVIIGRGERRPYTAQEADGTWVAYIRQEDQIFRASRIQIKSWLGSGTGGATTIRFREPHRILLNHLESHTCMTISRFRRIAGVSQGEADEILIDFMRLGLIRAEYSLNSTSYCLSDSYKSIIEGLSFPYL